MDFSSPELSRRMSRLIQNFGKRFIIGTLQRLQETYGIEIIEVNPAYSGKEYSSCGYIDKRNRKRT